MEMARDWEQVEKGQLLHVCSSPATLFEMIADYTEGSER